MPELPEVETVVRDLRKAGLEGRCIRDVRVRWSRLIAGCSPKSFAARIKYQTIQEITRRGKYIIFQLSGGETILVHLRMTGQFTLKAPATTRERHEHLVLSLDNGQELRYRDTRKFGRWHLTRHPEQILQKLGPEPLGRAFRLSQFTAHLATHRRLLKPLLLDQAFLAGLGNIYTDEALWEARLHPRRRAETLNQAEARSLFLAIRKILKRGIRYAGTSLGSGKSNFSGLKGRRGRHQEFLRVYQQTGEPCSRCGSLIRRLKIGQRSTHICPTCQMDR
ncbi:MAG: bifunctional DNA-formamidopyrimidine glycosylase/DNA-(apurinic or apyrimidinic site) lyase [Verrucomicrobia bacterium]|nr:bifunctional DNA-formamidopyrimidine glycosylase/DNA-(apurinic or apyrimidinic site) lyase [Verrucomicrobiota bacterium]MCG2681898.1 bifunctional DNA-formamidopyrimidine glycosylase/DNA-(apurinic or apyrimidinic site) lyase [Kiritimatiellia bacterium]MBU4246738.1 bifunctional DNA-formamidopyrimidine glycosylase/DNA-(apurinic or apyrimidinic site) lyase [Verrucomicrobiota bacterium]MBU4291159.1 bifunctional DNA-formamidopyrimidine glycosylase/DNA-(apurinic or apyrimidinic site) lyase [Verrucom